MMKYQIPVHFRHTRSTPFWTKETVPQALLTHHNTKKGVYGRLSVMNGAVKFFGFASEQATEPEMEVVIKAGQFGVTPPQYWHRIELLSDDTWFNLDFFADPNDVLEGKGIGQVVNTSRS